MADPQRGPIEAAQTQQTRQSLLQAVRQLPLGQRQVVILALEGFNQAEIGQALMLDENAVAQRMSRVRRVLRQWMRDEDDRTQRP